MIRYKSPSDIARLAEGGKILAALLEEIARAAVPRATTASLDQLARRLIAARKVKPSFLNYAPRGHDPFPAALCVSVNQAVVHGLPSAQQLKQGDIVGLDLGIIYKGLYLDSARTVAVGKVSAAATTLLTVTRQALQKGIAAACVGNHIGDIGAAVQHYVERQGFSVVRQLVGHGVGYGVHEAPAVPNFGSPHTGLELKSGLVIAIEPMVTSGDPTVTVAADGWTVETKSGQLAAHEEHTVAIRDTGPLVLTAL